MSVDVLLAIHGKDLQRIVHFNMLSDTAIVVGDNVLRPGAPQFMYWNSVAGPYETQVVSLREYKQDRICLHLSDTPLRIGIRIDALKRRLNSWSVGISSTIAACAVSVWGPRIYWSAILTSQEVVEDWMSVSFWLPHSAEAQIPMSIPEAVEQLGHDTDGIRWQSVPCLTLQGHLQTCSNHFKPQIKIQNKTIKKYKKYRKIKQIQVRFSFVPLWSLLHFDEFCQRCNPAVFWSPADFFSFVAQVESKVSEQQLGE